MTAGHPSHNTNKPTPDSAAASMLAQIENGQRGDKPAGPSSIDFALALFEERVPCQTHRPRDFVHSLRSHLLGRQLRSALDKCLIPPSWLEISFVGLSAAIPIALHSAPPTLTTFLHLIVMPMDSTEYRKGFFAFCSFHHLCTLNAFV